MAVAVAAIRALTSVVKNSSAQTMMGLEKELKDAAASLESCNPTAISLKAGCELFLRYTTRTSALESENFADAKNRIIEVYSDWSRSSMLRHLSNFVKLPTTSCVVECTMGATLKWLARNFGWIDLDVHTVVPVQATSTGSHIVGLLISCLSGRGGITLQTRQIGHARRLPSLGHASFDQVQWS